MCPLGVSKCPFWKNCLDRGEKNYAECTFFGDIVLKFKREFVQCYDLAPMCL